MAEIKKDRLEKALEDTGKKAEKKDSAPRLPKEMEIGFHQGSLNTLINERNELIKTIQKIESVMQAHIKRLEELGVKIRTTSANEKK